MSKTKKRRLRKSTRITYIVILIVILIFSISQIVLLLKEDKTSYKKREIYNYTNKFNYQYTVNLIENKYIDETSLGMTQTAYVTDLIDNLNLKLNYNYVGSEDSKISYKYSITGVLSAVYTRDGEEQKILEKNYNIVDEKQESKTSNNIDISEDLVLDLKEQNKLIKDFEQNMNMSLDATYVVTLNIETTTKVQGEEVVNKISPKITIDIGKKTTKISGDNNQENTEYVSTKIQEEKVDNNAYFIIYGVIVVAVVMALKYIVSKTEESVVIRNEYRQQINRILRLCQDKIVQVKSKPEIDEERLIEVKDFGELVKLSEELFKPILFWDDKEKFESWFIVMSNHTAYRYIIRKD